MTLEELKQYGSIKREIEDLERRIEKSYSKELDAVAGKVKGSMKDFPYTEIRTSVLMENPVQLEERDRLIAKRRSKVKELQKQVLAIEQFINTIGDSRIRSIFRYRFIDGLRVQEIAYQTGYTHGRISQLICKYIKD